MKNYVDIYKPFFVAVFLFFFSIIGCRQENIITLPEDDNSIIEQNDVITNLLLDIATNDGSLDNILDFANCFRIKLPVTVIANGREVEVNSNQDLDIIRAIFDESPIDTDVLELIFPVKVIMTDYTERAINSPDELHALADTCNGENEEDDDIECIDFLYPISFSVYNTLTEQIGDVVINNDQELYIFIQNLTNDEVASLNFPVTLVLSDNSEQTVTNLEELENLIESVRNDCDEDDDFDYTDDDFNDIQSPSVPLNLRATNITENSVELTWDAAVDNIGVTLYDIYIDGELNISTAATIINLIELDENTIYAIYIVAQDAAGNTSDRSNEIGVQTLAASDLTAPSAPTNLVASNITQTTVDLSWDAATDNLAVSAYDIYQDDTNIGSTSALSFSVSQLMANTAYSFNVIARDEANNNSVSSNVVVVNTLVPAGDVEAPSTPLNLVATNTVLNTVDLTWDPSTDNVGVIGYDVYMDNEFVAFVHETNYQVENLSYNTSYRFRVLAKDGEGNLSAFSNVATIMIQSAPRDVDFGVLTTCSNWRVDQLVRDNIDLSDSYTNYILNFNEDGSLTVDDGNQTFVGTWRREPFAGIIQSVIIDVPALPDFTLDWVEYFAREFEENTILELRRQVTANILRLVSDCN